MPCSGFNVSTPEAITISHLRTGVLNQTKTGMASIQFSSPYKGVVPRHNGKWAAQIYAGHRRLWLGTFNSELEAALAYDRVCLKLRSAEGSHNLLNGKQCQIENNFQELYTKDQVVQMIKDHSYPERFKYFISIKGRAGESNQNINNVRRYGQLMVRLQHLFDKEMTPSDVGKLNRLVIPKLHAERNFLPESQINKRDETLVFVDKNSKEWEFRYSFWKSSQSYVLTRGWSRFVKEKQLQAGDIVSFQRCRANGKLYISVTHRPAYSRPTADSISIRCQHITYSSPPPAQLVVNPHDCQRLIEFHNKNSVLHSSVLPFQMGYCSECVDNGGPHLEEESKMGYCSECVDMNGGPQLEEESNVEAGRLSNIDMTMEDSLFPTHETQDDDGGRDHITVASVSSYSLMPHARIKETTSHCIRLFGVEMGTVLKNGES